MTPPYPLTAGIDFGNLQDIEASAAAIISTFPAPRTLARQWIKEVEKRFDHLTAGDSLSAADCYELVHPVAFGTPAGRSLLDNIRLSAFGAFLRGDKSVDRYTLQRTIARELSRHNKKFLGNPLQWESACIARWHRQFRHGISIDPMSDYDTINRVSALLSSDLWAFETRNENSFKQNLFRNHRSFLDNAEYASDRRHPLNKSLRILLSASIPYLSETEYRTYACEL